MQPKLAIAQPSTQKPNATLETLERNIQTTFLRYGIMTKGQIAFPCSPCLVDHAMTIVEDLSTTLGCETTALELAELQQAMTQLVELEFAATPHSKLILDYEPLDDSDVGYSWSLSTLRLAPVVSGEVSLPCQQEYLDDAIAQLERLLTVKNDQLQLDQILDQRHSLETLISTGSQHPDTRLVIRYEPSEPGLTVNATIVQATDSTTNQSPISFAGRVMLPCVPSILEYAINLIQRLAKTLGCNASEPQLIHICQTLRDLVFREFHISPTSHLVIDYQPELVNGGYAWSFSSLSAPPFIRGEIRLPALPSMLADGIQFVDQLLEVLGNRPPQEQLTTWQQQLAPLVQQTFAVSPNSNVLIQYQSQQSCGGGITLHGGVNSPTIAEAYQQWVDTREAPLFGCHPDAKLMAIAADLGDPATAAVLDVGAGTGRNSFPLAQLGHPVTALEVAPVFVQELQIAAAEKQLPITVLLGDILNPNLQIQPGAFKLAIASEVIATHFRHSTQIRQLLANLCQEVQQNGLILVSAFLATEDYVPDDRVRELSQQRWSCIFTRQELTAAIAGLPLKLISDDLVYDFERENLPQEAFPPTGWFTNWATGRDLLPLQLHEQSWMNLHWLLFKRL